MDVLSKCSSIEWDGFTMVEALVQDAVTRHNGSSSLQYRTRLCDTADYDISVCI